MRQGQQLGATLRDPLQRFLQKKKPKKKTVNKSSTICLTRFPLENKKHAKPIKGREKSDCSFVFELQRRLITHMHMVYICICCTCMLIYFAKYQLSANSLARNENCIATLRCGKFHFSFRLKSWKRVAGFALGRRGGDLLIIIMKTVQIMSGLFFKLSS